MTKGEIVMKTTSALVAVLVTADAGGAASALDAKTFTSRSIGTATDRTL
jgi:hypothetical protein